jgi:hypothetical protein
MQTYISTLPVYTGTYCTLFKYEYEYSEEDEDDEFDYGEFYFQQAIMVTHVMRDRLKEAKLVSDIQFLNLVRPREYNFQNDHIKVEYSLSDLNGKRISRMMRKCEKAFTMWLNEHYSPRDGFHSFVSTDFNYWAQMSEGFTNFSFERDTALEYHGLGIILEFICEHFDIIDEETLAELAFEQML